MFEDFGLLVGRHFTTLPSLSDTQPSELQLDSSGRLILSGRWLSGTDAYVSGDAGLSALAVRNDAGGALSGVDDGEYTPLQVDSTGALRVNATVNVDSQSQYAEDSAHSDGAIGEFILGIRVSDITADNSAFLAGTDGDYQAYLSSDRGEMFVKDADVLSKLTDIETTIDDGIDVSITASGNEAYTVTDDLAAAGDALATITAAATPWVAVSTLSVPAGQTAFVYGWQFACDQNCQARIMTDDTTDEIVYKTSVNSSAMPTVSEHWAEGGVIEIPGAAGLELRIEMKKRNAAGGNANGTGSLHVRLV